VEDTDDAVRARTSVDRARVGELTTYARHPSRRLTTSVGLQVRPEGTVDVHLSTAAHAVAQLLARPLATLRVAPPWCEPVLLHGGARRLPGLTDHGELVFRLEVAAVRVGSPPVPVDEAAYSAARPDPLRCDAPAVLAHLNEGHADALSACLRARGREVAFAQATRLDAGGLTVVAVGPDGADTVRLRFPTPVAALDELPPSLAWVLRPGCGCCTSSRRSADGAGA
jgi:hypothetical protein